MPEKAPSPFASLGGLDKALLRSTQHPAATTEQSTEQSRPSAEPASLEPQPITSEEDSRRSNTQPGKRTRNADSNRARKTDTELASNDTSYQAIKLAVSTDIIQTIRKAVKTPGKEVSFVRLTAEEKGQLADIVYTYKRQGKKTSENELNRIAINYILQDYKANGEHSILAGVIEALLA